MYHIIDMEGEHVKGYFVSNIYLVVTVRVKILLLKYNKISMPFKFPNYMDNKQCIKALNAFGSENEPFPEMSKQLFFYLPRIIFLGNQRVFD